MSWLSLLLLCVGLSDLLASTRPAWRRMGLLAAVAATAAVAGLAALLTLPDLIAVGVIFVATCLWSLMATHAESSPVQARRTLATLAIPAAALLAGSGYASPVGGPFAAWLSWVDVPALANRTPGQALMLAAVVVANLSTANRVVRLALVAVDAHPPRLVASSGQGPASETLRGGRLLGPMERLLIIGFGAAGHIEAAAVVVAAKGILRFPELQAAARREPRAVDEVTEYFLVGTFASLLVALASVVLLT